MAVAASKFPFAEQGKRIRAARKRKGISQENFAALIGTTRRHQIRIENGEHQPSGPLLERIAAETGSESDSFGYPNGSIPSDDDEESEPTMFNLDAYLVYLVRKEVKRAQRETEVSA